MTRTPSYLITGAGGGVGGVSRLVVEQLLSHGAAVRAMVHRDDSRADALRALTGAADSPERQTLEANLARIRGVH